MKSRIFGGESLESIGWDFNRRGIPGPGPKNGLWHSNTMRRIVISEVHLGKIISNKTKGSGHKKESSATGYQSTRRMGHCRKLSCRCKN